MKGRPGVWRLAVYLGRDETGRKRYRTRHHKGTKTSANAALRDLITEVELEATRSAEAETSVRGWVEAHVERNASSWAPSGVARARQVIEHDLDRTGLGSIPLADLRPVHVQRWVDALSARTAPATVRRTHGVLNSALNAAVRLEHLDRNPAALVTLPRLRRTEYPQVPDDALAAALAAAAQLGEAPYLLVRLAAATGGRRGQLVGLRWADLDGAVLSFRRAVSKGDSGFVVKDTKTGREYRLTLDPGTVEDWHAYRRHRDEQAAAFGATLSDDSYVFAQDIEGRTPLYPDTAGAWWRKIRSAEGVGLDTVRLHDLRHAHATGLLADGADLPAVAARLGHASPTTTLRVYAHAVAAGDARAAELTGSRLPPPRNS